MKVNYNNGPIEETNNKIKVIKYTVYGPQSFLNCQAQILLAFLLPIS
ncbi:transposase [Limosilactobacillus sp.]